MLSIYEFKFRKKYIITVMSVGFFGHRFLVNGSKRKRRKLNQFFLKRC